MSETVLSPTRLQPSSTRAPFFDGWQIENVSYRSDCPSCHTQLVVPFSDIRAGAWGWRERFSSADAAAIERFFALGERSKALAGGWPSISEVTCDSCGAQFIFYADFDEYRHSAFRIVAQGLAARDT
jgi:hypothetical protein